MPENPISPLLKVVTVDDSPIIAERIAFILSEIENVTYLGNAFNISSALNLINAVKPDVVILDIHLGQDKEEQTGIDLLVEIRQDYPKMKIIIFTNHSETRYRIACIKKGADYFFDKSNDSHQISELLKQWTVRK